MTTPAPLVDQLVDPLLLELRDCLCAELTRSPFGPVCRCYLVHAFTTPIDDGCACECESDGQTGVGEARVRLVSLEPDSASIGPGPQACAAGWQAVVEFTTARCVPVPEDPQEPLPVETLTKTALDLGGDRAAMLRVLSCCQALRDRDIMVEFLSPRGQGDCLGWLMQFRVALPGGPEAAC